MLFRSCLAVFLVGCTLPAEEPPTAHDSAALGEVATWSSSGDFPDLAGSAGWSYLQGSAGEVFSPMTYVPARGRYEGTSSYCFNGPTWMHPGVSARAVRKWVAPASPARARGTRVRLRGSVRRPDSRGDGANVWIHHHPAGQPVTPLWQGFLSDTKPHTVDVSVWLEPGEPIYIIVDNAGTASYDTVLVDIDIDEAPRVAIPAAGLDHADPTLPGTLAAQFAAHDESSGDPIVYELTGGDEYFLTGPVRLPARASLVSDSAVPARLTATPAAIGKSHMLELSDYSALRGIHLDGRHHTHRIVHAGETHHLRIIGSTLENSRNDYACARQPASEHPSCTALPPCVDEHPRPHLLHAPHASYAIIESSSFFNAGTDSYLPQCWPADTTASALNVNDAYHLVVVGSQVWSALAHGIHINNATHVVIEDNVIERTGLTHTFGPDKPAQSGDGIGGYHPDCERSVDYQIRGNYIRESFNQGIHVAGWDIAIEDNVVEDGANYGIFVQDWRDPIVYSRNVVVRDNVVRRNVADDIRVERYYAGTVTAPGASFGYPIYVPNWSWCGDFGKIAK